MEYLENHFRFVLFAGRGRTAKKSFGFDSTTPHRRFTLTDTQTEDLERIKGWLDKPHSSTLSAVKEQPH